MLEQHPPAVREAIVPADFEIAAGPGPPVVVAAQTRSLIEPDAWHVGDAGIVAAVAIVGGQEFLAKIVR